MSKDEKVSRVVYYALALRDVVLENERNPSRETKNNCDDTWSDFLDSLEIYENGELDLTNRDVILDPHGN